MRAVDDARAGTTVSNSAPASSDLLALDRKQGAIEFWIRRFWDERVAPIEPFSLLTGSGANIFFRNAPVTLPLGEWVHVAPVWRPAKQHPNQILSHWYVNGIDHSFYRNLWWEGYGVYGAANAAGHMSSTPEVVEEFIVRAGKGAAFAIDELRISSVPRYADLDIELGHRFPNNTFRFNPRKRTVRGR